MALLEIDPERRPTASAILAQLSGQDIASSATAMSGVVPSPFVGRKSAMATLDAALAATEDGALSTVYVEAESGLGKTTLVNEWLRRNDDASTLVLKGRCHERESVSYNALDGAIDRLTDFLRRVPEEEAERLMPTRAAWLPELFPVLGSVPAIAEARTRARPPENPETRRSVLFDALRDLFGRVGERRRVLLVLDDLQWADQESLALLDELLRPPDPPSLLVIGILRAGGETPSEVREALARWDEAAGHCGRIVLAGLQTEQAQEMASRLCGDPVRAQAIAEESEGRPLFIEMLVRYSSIDAPAPSLDEAITRGAATLDAPARRLLDAACLSGAGLAPRVLAAAARVEAEELPRLVRELRRDHWLRVRRTIASEVIEPYHDRIRLAVERACAERAPQLHRDLAVALAGEKSTDHELLARHWEGAGEPEHAAEAARQAAESAAVRSQRTSFTPPLGHAGVESLFHSPDAVFLVCLCITNPKKLSTTVSAHPMGIGWQG